MSQWIRGGAACKKKKKRAGPADKIQTQTKSFQGSVCSLDVTEPSGACWERSRSEKFSGGTVDVKQQGAGVGRGGVGGGAGRGVGKVNVTVRYNLW